MYKVRVGNDINIQWRIFRNDSPEDFAGKTLRLLMRGTSQTIEVRDYVLEGNVIKWEFKGKDQRGPSTFTFTLIENEGKDDMFTVDKCDVLRLVSCSCQADDDDGRFDMFIDTDIVLPAPGRDGLSAYEIAVLHGFNGTEEEWLAFLGTGVRYVEVALEDDYVIPANPYPGGEVLYCILVGDTPHAVTAEEGVKWFNGIQPAPIAGSALVVSIVNNLAVWGTFR